MIFNRYTVFHRTDVPLFIKPISCCLLKSSFQIFTYMISSSMNNLLHKIFLNISDYFLRKFCKVELLDQKKCKPEQSRWYFGQKNNSVSCKVLD